MTSDAAATLTLHYTDTSNAEKSATCSMTRYSNYFYAYVELPKDCTSVEKLSAHGHHRQPECDRGEHKPGHHHEGQAEPDLGQTGQQRDADHQEQQRNGRHRSLSRGSSGMELSLPEGEYTLSATAYVSGLGNQTLLERTTVAVTEGATHGEEPQL